ncbi:hypothetical protein SAMN05192534_109120 [Alteribacillus persepolensis]|uniref:Uncharacterized protein n=1 Tax=Alteribacillus persepolensis TaxID=568899 RepID=A0A1G8EJ51_9BACI|nr:hypothetical protein SAMN05192534_109120 [Alteribacillus persepolensis]
MIGRRVPLVFAMPLLPFVVPGEMIPLLPVGTLFSSCFLLFASLAYKKWQTKEKREHAKFSPLQNKVENKQ